MSIGVDPSSTLAVVGESGAGKSTLGLMLLRLLRPTTGTIRFDGTDIWQCDRRTIREFRRRVQGVFQDPFSSFDPRWSLGRSIEEPLVIHRVGDGPSRRRAVADALDAVQLTVNIASRLPKEVSGGQLQRAAIARALVLRPDVIVCDEPLAALDVSVQAQIVGLLATVREERGVGLVIISHDLPLVEYMADNVAVMYHGEMVESGRTQAVFSNPSHAYTRRLLDAIPPLAPPDWWAGTNPDNEPLASTGRPSPDPTARDHKERQT